jgi:hypothetical protein
MSEPKIGHVLPVGGPVPPDYVIGRSGEIDQLVTQLSESIHTMASGERKIGKTTVCDAACARVKPELEIVRIEVPERKDADARVLLQSIIDRFRTRRPRGRCCGRHVRPSRAPSLQPGSL